MNVCVLYHGQLRTFKNVINSHVENILNFNNDDIKVHILYTTWNEENVDDFKGYYKNSYIRKVDLPKREQMKWDERFIPHNSNPHFNGDVFPYFCQLTIWKEAYKTILEYEELKKIKMDVIIRLRPDTIFIKNISNKNSFFYLNDNSIYVPMQNRFDVYGTGSVPDQVAWGKRDCVIKILNAIDIVHEVQQEQFVFHPETSLHNIIKYHSMNIVYCDVHTDVLRNC